MKKQLIIITALLASVLMLSGCMELFDKGKSQLVDVEWKRSDGLERLFLNSDNTGTLLRTGDGEDLLFQWSIDSQRDNTLIWTIQDSGEVIVVKFYFVADNNYLVLDFLTGSPWVYYKVVAAED